MNNLLIVVVSSLPNGPSAHLRLEESPWPELPSPGDAWFCCGDEDSNEVLRRSFTLDGSLELTVEAIAVEDVYWEHLVDDHGFTQD